MAAEICTRPDGTESGAARRARRAAGMLARGVGGLAARVKQLGGGALPPARALSARCGGGAQRQARRGAPGWGAEAGACGGARAPAGRFCATQVVHNAPAAPARAATPLQWLRVAEKLSKFRLSAFVASTASAGFVLGSGEVVDWAGCAYVTVGTLLASSCANTLNQVYETANDGRMARTMRRPLPSGACSRAQALAFAAACGVGGVGLLFAKCGPEAAALGAGNIVLYAGVYTPLKQLSVANTWVGALVGGVPPLMGWAAAAGGLQAGSMVLAGMLYYWQLPHFMSLAWMHREDYARGGYRMLPILDASGRRVANVALRNAAALLPLAYAAHALGVTEEAFAWESAAMALALLVSSAAFRARLTNATARTLFFTSLGYLPLAMAAMCWHRQPNLAADAHAQQAMRVAQAATNQGAAGNVPNLLGARSAADEALPRALALEQLSLAPFPFLPPPMLPARPLRLRRGDGEVEHSTAAGEVEAVLEGDNAR